MRLRFPVNSKCAYISKSRHESSSAFRRPHAPLFGIRDGDRLGADAVDLRRTSRPTVAEAVRPGGPKTLLSDLPLFPVPITNAARLMLVVRGGNRWKRPGNGRPT
jgi:hypothetical protein